MHIISNIFKLLIIVILSLLIFYLYKNNIYVYTYWDSYSVRVSLALILVVIFVLFYIYLKIYKMFICYKYRLVNYFNIRKKNSLILGLYSSLESQFYFKNKDKKAFSKHLYDISNLISNKEDIFKFLKIQKYILDGDILNAINLYRKICKKKIGLIISDILYDVGTEDEKMHLLQIQKEYSCICFKGYIFSCDTLKSFNDVLSFLNKFNLKEEYNVLLLKYAIKFNHSDQIEYLIKVLRTTVNYGLIKDFSKFKLDVKNFLKVENIFKDTNESFVLLSLSLLSSQAGIYGISRSYIEKLDKLEVDSYYLNYTLMNIELKENGVTDKYIDYINNFLKK